GTNGMFGDLISALINCQQAAWHRLGNRDLWAWGEYGGSVSPALHPLLGARRAPDLQRGARPFFGRSTEGGRAALSALINCQPGDDKRAYQVCAPTPRAACP